MPGPKCSDEEFLALFPVIGARGIHERFGVELNNVYERRNRLQKKYGVTLASPTVAKPRKEYPQRVSIDLLNGCVLVGSDLHRWPGAESTALRAFKKFVD